MKAKPDAYDVEQPGNSGFQFCLLEAAGLLHSPRLVAYRAEQQKEHCQKRKSQQDFQYDQYKLYEDPQYM